MTLDADAFAADRPRLFAIAYRMVGVAADADELIQETWLRLQERGAEPDDLGAYSTRVLTRLCIDHMRSARVRRESYVGPWLPEPLRTGSSDRGGDPERALAMAQSAQIAFLLVLEKLGPVERAVFLLREVFDYDYAAISDLVGKREDACRQVARRARERVRGARPVTSAEPGAHAALLGAFFAAAAGGDAAALESMLTDDAVLLSDGGGVVTAALRPILGPVHIARFAVGTSRKNVGLRPEVATLNGHTALLLWRDDALYSTVQFDIRGERIQAIYIVRNPAKLRRL